MPPTTPRITIPTPLIPQPETYIDGTASFAGLPIVPARSLQQDAWCALFYAAPGVGKTTLAGMFSDYPDACDVLVVDAEGGASAISNKDNVYVMQAATWRDIDKVVTTLERMPADAIRWKTVVFDNLSEMQTMQMQTITTGEIGIQHWGMNTAAMLRFTRRVRDLARFKGINVVLLAWRDTAEDEYTKIVRHGVALTNKLAARLPGVVNMVGYISILNNPPLYTRRLSFAASPTTDAKFRSVTGTNFDDIPQEIYYRIDQNPIVDILTTLYEGKPFPAHEYTRPKNARQTAPAGSAQPAPKSEDSGDEESASTPLKRRDS